MTPRRLPRACPRSTASPRRLLHEPPQEWHVPPASHEGPHSPARWEVQTEQGGSRVQCICCTETAAEAPLRLPVHSHCFFPSCPVAAAAEFHRCSSFSMPPERKRPQNAIPGFPVRLHLAF